MQDITQTGGGKMNLNIAICDDEMTDIEILKESISRYNIATNNNIITSSFTSSQHLISDFSEHSYDLVLLDIEMPKINGIELARYLREIDDDLFIVFTTSYPKYMHDSFEVQPFQFLTKPIEYDAVFKLFNDIIAKVERSSKNIVIVDAENEKHFVTLKDILFISSMKENKSHVRYQLSNGELISKGTLSDIENKLAARGFISPSRGFLVNVNHIKTINANNIILNDDYKIPVSRRRAKDLHQIYSQFIIDIL